MRVGGQFQDWSQSPNVVVDNTRDQGDGYANPGATLPLPTPDAKLRPVGYNEEEPRALGWGFGSGNVARTALWGSSVMNLRTDLRGVTSREPGGVPVNRLFALQLFIAVSGLAQNHVGMEVYKAELGHPTDPELVDQFTPWTNITANLSTGTDLAILNYFPPGSGYQMLYWQVKLRFDFVTIAPPATLPMLVVTSGIY